MSTSDVGSRVRPNHGAFATEQEALDALVARLVEALDPQAIWLFGSRARGDHRMDGYFAVPDQRTDLQPASRVRLDGRQAVQRIDVEHHGRLHQAKVQHRHQALSTGQHQCVIAMFGKHLERMLDGRCANV